MRTITFKSESHKKMNLLIQVAHELGVEIIVPDLDEEDLKWLTMERKKSPVKKSWVKKKKNSRHTLLLLSQRQFCGKDKVKVSLVLFPLKVNILHSLTSNLMMICKVNKSG